MDRPVLPYYIFSGEIGLILRVLATASSNFGAVAGELGYKLFSYSLFCFYFNFSQFNLLVSISICFEQVNWLVFYLISLVGFMQPYEKEQLLKQIPTFADFASSSFAPKPLRKTISEPSSPIERNRVRLNLNPLFEQVTSKKETIMADWSRVVCASNKFPTSNYVDSSKLSRSHKELHMICCYFHNWTIKKNVLCKLNWKISIIQRSSI